MPLKTTTINLRDERDRLNSQLDDLAEQVAALEAEHGVTIPEDLGSDDIDQSVIADCQELFEEYTQTQNDLAGVAWAVETFGSEVATDGGHARMSEPSDEDPRADTDSESEPDIDAVREQMMDEDDSSDVAVSYPDDQPVEASNPSKIDERAHRPSDTEGSSPSTTGSEGLTVTLGGLTAGELAQMTDTQATAGGGQQPQRVGFGQQDAGPDLGSQRVRYVAAGHVDAPYIEVNAALETKIMAVADLSPNYVAWCEKQINELTTPSESVGNDFETRLESARERRTTSDTTTDTEETTT